jgi:ribosomal protein L7/L12
MNSREYHIQTMVINAVKVYRVVITLGLMDAKTVGPFALQKNARQFCKDNALAAQVKPIIIY